MIKKYLLLLLIVIAISGTVAFADPSMGGEPVYGKIFLSNQEVTFTSTPFVINDVIMVPAKLFCEKLGAQVLWNEASREMISYRDNIFIKFKNNSSVAYINGKPKSMPVSSFTFKGELYIPASFAAAAHELAFVTERSSHAMSIDFRENILEYRQIDFRHFKRISLTNYGISFYVPEYWSEVADKITTYGVENSFESYAFEANVMTLNSQYTRPILTESILDGLVAEHGNAINLVSSNTLVLGEYTSDAIYYDLSSDGVLTHHILYIFFEQNNGYVFKATYPDTNDLEESRQIFDTIASTFGITKLTVNEQLEHYTEMTRFSEYGVTLFSEIHSNMIVNNHFQLKGTIAHPKNIKGLNVIVSKDGDNFEYYVPLIDKAFNIKLYTPFGLGKHNITVILDESASREDTIAIDALTTLDDYIEKTLLSNHAFDEAETILKFSVLNASNEPIKDLLPTTYINYDQTSIYNITNRITYNLTNQYSKSKALYEWIVSNYTLDDQLKPNGLLTAKELVEVKSANSVELCILYTALLRSVDIPARIVRGITEDDIDYWVEIFLNGQWLVTSISQETQYKFNVLTYFNLDRLAHYENYSIIEQLPF
jgi:hypothetical protein